MQNQTIYLEFNEIAVRELSSYERNFLPLIARDYPSNCWSVVLRQGIRVEICFCGEVLDTLRRSRLRTALKDYWAGGRFGRELPLNGTVLNIVDFLPLADTRSQLLPVLEALETVSGLLDRHQMFETAHDLAFKDRENPEMLELAENIAWLHFQEFSSMIGMYIERVDPYVRQRYPPNSFRRLVTMSDTKGEFGLALVVCEQAMAWGLEDGTTGGYAKRASQIVKKMGQSGASDERERALASRLESAKQAFEEMKKNLRLEREKRRREIRQVPTFRFESEYRRLTDAQEEFYGRWVEAWSRGEVLALERQIGYALVYALNVILKKPRAEARNELLRIRDSYADSELDELAYRCCKWASDCNVSLGQYRKAIDLLPSLSYSARLSLILATREGLRGVDVVALFGGSCLTNFGLQHRSEIEPHVGRRLADYEAKNGISLLQEWANCCAIGPFMLFSGTSHLVAARIGEYSFEGSTHKSYYMEILEEMVRQGENEMRRDHGIPPIGEGWVEESNLYYMIKEAFPNLQVLHHASPNWLGLQHLDIFIPELGIAVEYQGIQHDQPVEFFGGEDGFRRTVERDARKAVLCSQNGVRLLYARPDYVFEQILKDIRDGE